MLFFWNSTCLKRKHVFVILILPLNVKFKSGLHRVQCEVPFKTTVLWVSKAMQTFTRNFQEPYRNNQHVVVVLLHQTAWKLGMCTMTIKNIRTIKNIEKLYTHAEKQYPLLMDNWFLALIYPKVTNTYIYIFDIKSHKWFLDILWFLIFPALAAIFRKIYQPNQLSLPTWILPSCQVHPSPVRQRKPVAASVAISCHVFFSDHVIFPTPKMRGVHNSNWRCLGVKWFCLV